MLLEEENDGAEECESAPIKADYEQGKLFEGLPSDWRERGIPILLGV